jgi:hypothetical protein
MEVTFGNPAGAQPAPVIDVQSTVTPVPGVTVDSVNTHVPQPSPAASQLPAVQTPILGDELPDLGDIVFPRINIVQGSGKLKETYPQGAIVFNQQLVLFTPPVVNQATGNMDRPALPPVNLTVLGFKKTRYAEKVAGGIGGMIVNSEDQVRANGGTTDWNEHNLKKAAGMKLFQPLKEAVIAIERPAHLADDGSVFVYEIEGKKYTLGLWSMKGSSYTKAYKTVFATARLVGCLRNGYPTFSFNVSTRLEVDKRTGNSYYVPVCLPCKASTPAFLAFVREVIGAPAVTVKPVAVNPDGGE